MTEEAVGYVRVSTNEQAEGGVGLADQEERIRSYCRMAGLDLVQLVKDNGITGAKPLASRPGGIRLLKAVKARKVKNVVALKLDRLFRDAVDALTQTRAWDKQGVALHLIDMGGQTLNSRSAMGRLFLTMTAAFAELERNLIAERTAAALQHKKRHRQAYSPTPYGFTRKGDSLKANPAELAVVKKVQGWRKRHWTLRKIAGELNKRGIPTKTGKTWYASTVRYLLQNSLYSTVRA